MDKVLICGYGFVGKAVFFGFSKHLECLITDPKYPDISKSLSETVPQCKFIFVAVPTPFNMTTKKFDGSIICKVISEINDLSQDLIIKPIVVIKSAVLPSLTQSLVKDNKNIDIVISPEFLRARSPYQDYVNVKCMILGGDAEICRQVAILYKTKSVCNLQTKIGICSAVEAAFIKYMENSWLGLKVIFLNQVKELYDKIIPESEQNYNYLIEMHHLDERMGTFFHPYTIPGPDGHKGYGNFCIPKDTNAFISEAQDYGVSLDLLEKGWEINLRIREDRDWEILPGAMVK